MDWSLATALLVSSASKKYQFGFAVNLDYYGPKKVLKKNYGALLRFNFHPVNDPLRVKFK
jgi:hypothetical protein